MDCENIPVIDLFAGPGGLGEGFSSFVFKKVKTDNRIYPFKITLSIEKDHIAHQTLLLRSFYRNLVRSGSDSLYYRLLKNGKINGSELELEIQKCGDDKIKNIFKQSCEEAICAELGPTNKNLTELIEKRIEIIRKTYGNQWILIGGPPCQAYSLAGRSRNKGIANYSIENDDRSVLYKEYLKVLALGLPAVFVMENVKGMLSARIKNRSVFQMILQDLKNPGHFQNNNKSCASYRIIPCVFSETGNRQMEIFDNYLFNEKDFIVRMEQFGIPQQRHRVILLGIREDLAKKIDPADIKLFLMNPTVNSGNFVTVKNVISDLPVFSALISNKEDKSGKKLKAEGTFDELKKHLEQSVYAPWTFIYHDKSPKCRKVIEQMRKVADSFSRRGKQKKFIGLFLPLKKHKKPDISCQFLSDWYYDSKLKGVLNHENRDHMDSDLVRYLFAGTFASVFKRSPVLSEFPKEILPRHKNAKSGHFNDRFRVQVEHSPASTITSHIAKDGHYFIHYDPSQCRSLTVREAARIQTFPDNYAFCGSRTSQYHQVGNAVPPFLARKIAETVWRILSMVQH